MTDTSSNGGQPAGQGAEGAQGGQPSIHVLGQYIKDLSFENPSAPGSLRQSDKQPQLDINVNVGARPVGQSGELEVEITLEAKAKRANETIFVAEVKYAGVFQIRNVPQDQMGPLVLIECPRLLFPFARQILADATRQGGFPPLLIDPIDFVALYRQKMAEANVRAQAAAAANTAGGGASGGEA